MAPIPLLLTAVRINNGLAPEKGPQGIFLNLDFTNATGQAVYADDLFTEQSMGEIDFIQSIHVNNKANAADLTIVMNGAFPIPLIVPLGKQAILPIYAPNPARFTISTTQAAGLIIPIVLLNVPLPYLVW